MNEQLNPLVSVAIVTYNSSQTIIETLESVYAQTYQNIELVISDDCSSDNTMTLCHNWVEKHKDRFVRVEIITTPRNTGVSANYNRGMNSCFGEWVKDFDGDDIMLPNCIQDCVDYVTEHSDTVYLFGRCQVFGGTQEMQEQVESQFRYDFFDLPLDQQYRRLIYEGNCLPSSTAFYHRERVKATGVKNDERIPLLEDWPKWINLVKAGVRFAFIDKVTVMYRISEGALSTNFNSFSDAYLKSVALCYLFYQYPIFRKDHYDWRTTYYRYLRARKTISKHKFIWGIICKAYKICIMHR